MGNFKIVKLVDPIVIQTNGVNASILGNTAGTPAIVSSGTMYLAGGNNVTLSQSGNTISINGGAGGGGGGIGAAAGTQTATSGTVLFNNGGGVTFGMSNSSVITATVATNYQSQGAYLTTARASNDAIGLNTALTANGLSVTANSSGLSINVPAWLTTAMQSASSSVFAKTGFTTASTAGTDIVGTHDTNGLSMGIPKYITTAQPVGAYLTTARASNDAVGLNTAQTNVTWTVNSAGISLNAGAYLTTAQPVGAYLTTARASNDAVGLNTAGTNVTWTVNSSGISLNAGAYLTTAMASNRGTDFVQAGAAFAGTNASGTIASNGISVSVNPAAAGVGIAAGTRTATTAGNILFDTGNGITFGLNAVGGSIMTASHNGLTTAMASNRGTDFVQANAAFNGTNASGTIASNNISVSVAAQSVQPVAASASNGSYNFSTLKFVEGSGVTWATQANGIQASVKTDYQSQGAYLTTAMQSNAATISNINMSAGTTSLNLSKLTFADSNGVSFGLSGNSVITATVATNYQSQGAYLTTAMASNRGTDFVQANAAFAGTNASGTIASNGISISVNPAGGADGVNILAAGTQTANTTGTVLFNNGGGVTFGMSNSSIITATVATNYQSQGAYLTTARASNDAVGLNTAGTNVTWTVNSSGISLNAGAYLTTAQPVGAYLTTARASNDAVGLNTAITNGTWTVNSSGISLNLSNHLTTARASNDAVGLNTAITNGTWTVNSSGISLNLSNHLTTARASNDAIGLNTAQTNVTWTVNSSGISLNAGAYLTTAMASNRGSDFVNATAAFAGTNASGTIASNGISVSVAAPGGGGALAASASNGSFTFSTLGFSNANNVTFGTSAGSIITASVAAPGAAAENNWVNLLGGNTAGNTTASGSTIGVSGINLTLSGTNGSIYNISAPATSSLSATGQVSLSVNGSTISIGVPSAVTFSRYNEFKESPMVAGQIGQASLHIQPWLVPNLQFDRVVQHVAFSNASNSSFSYTYSNWVGIYTRNVSTLSLLHSVSLSTNFSASGTVGSYSLWGGAGYRGVTAGLTQTLTEGMYWLGVVSRTTTGGGAGQTLNQMLNSNVNSSYSGLIGAGSNATNQISLGMGVYSATTSAMPNSIAFTEINGNSSIMLRPPSLYFVSGTI